MRPYQRSILTYASLIFCLAFAGCGSGASGGTSRVNQSNPAPSLSGVSPAVLAAGSPAVTITLTGTNFVNSSSAVANGTTVLATSFVSSGQLTAAVPSTLLSSTGTLSLGVSNPAPGGGSSGSAQVQVVSVGSVALLANPADATNPAGTWATVARVSDPSGNPISGIPVNFASSAGSVTEQSSLTDSQGTASATLAPPGNSATIVALTTTVGAQAASVDIEFAGLPQLKTALTKQALMRNASSQTQSANIGSMPLVYGFSNASPGFPTNAFSTPNPCVSNVALLSPITPQCQSIFTQNSLQSQINNLTQLGCGTVTVASNVFGVASCAGVVVTAVSCVFSATGVGAMICAGALSLPPVIGPEALLLSCADYILGQIVQQSNPNNQFPLDLAELQVNPDPLDPTSELQVLCDSLQNTSPTGEIIFVADYLQSKIVEFDRNGSPITLPQGAFPNIDHPDGLAYDPQRQYLFVTNLNNKMLTVYDTNGNQVFLSGTFAGLSAAGDIEDVLFDQLNRRLYVNDPVNNQILVFDENGNAINLDPGAFPNLSQPWGIALNTQNGYLYVSNGGSQTVTVYDGDGNQVAIPGAFQGLSIPDDISWDPVSGKVYVVNDGNNTITVYDPNGNLVSVSGNFPGLNSPDQIVSDGNPLSPVYFVANLGSLVFGSYTGNGQVIAYDSSGKPVVFTGGFPGLSAPAGVIVVN